jgi:hypothetical protein
MFMVRFPELPRHGIFRQGAEIQALQTLIVRQV